MSTVLEGLSLAGGINTSDDQLLANVSGAVRLGFPQVWPQPAKPERIALVGSGPSLNDTAEELRELVWSGAKLVTLNGAYHWCIERNLKPSAQIVLDARPTTSRFVQPAVPDCRYYVASQCHPDVFDALVGRPHVGLWHSVVRVKDEPDQIVAALDRYYAGHWTGIPGGTTVAMRALLLLRTLGYLRFDLFGVDSCWMGEEHHALAQPENDAERRLRITVAPSDRPDLARDFWCAPWHAQQLEDFLLIVRHHGDSFQLAVHGTGLLAYVLESAAASADGDISLTKE